jgi:hypothetical protein
MVSAGDFAPIVVQTTACGGAGSVLFVEKSWEASLWSVVLRKAGYQEPSVTPNHDLMRHILLYSFDWLKVPRYSFGTLLRVCFLFVR